MADKLVVAAIDIGTTFSGTAYCFKHEFESDPSNIHAKHWNNGSNISTKTPTTVLIAPDGESFVAFGYEAEDRFAALCAENKERGYYYFRQFKMMLHNKLDIGKRTFLKDEFGKQLPAKDVFKHAIKYLRDDLLKECSKGIIGTFQHKDIQWVLTVPAIWNEMAKRFMREAAEEAGIPSNCLKIALEPEAASIYCKMMALEKKAFGTLAITSFEQGAKYIVLDAGGGTVDVSVHEVLDDGNLRELHKASGGAWGGTTVDDAYEDMLVTIFGQNVFNKFKEENMDDYIDIFRNFEIRKRTVSTTTEHDTVISLPTRLVETYTDETSSAFIEAIQTSNVSNFVKPGKGNKLIIKADCMRQLFSLATDNITRLISNLLKMYVIKEVKTIIMVGGLSESSIVYETVKKLFPDMNVVVPPGAVLTVLKGAVMFGYKPTAITERISPYTYGIGGMLPFQTGVHPDDKLVYDIIGEPWCRDCFDKIIVSGRHIKLNERIRCERTGRPSRTTRALFSVYGSTDPDPKYVTDDTCFFVGDFYIYFPDTENPDNLEKAFLVYLVLGDTELRLEVEDLHTKEIHTAQFKLKR